MYHSAFATLPVENGDLKSNSGCLPRELSSVKLLACLSDAELFHYLELSIRVPSNPEIVHLSCSELPGLRSGTFPTFG